MFNRIITVDKLLKHIQDEAALTFIKDLSHVTCDCLENAVKEEMVILPALIYKSQLFLYLILFIYQLLIHHIEV